MIRARMALVVLAGVAAALSGTAPAGARAAGTVTRPVRVTAGDSVPTRTYSSPAMAVDPEDENTVVAAYAEMRTARCGVARSSDGGRTWKRLDASPSLTSYPFCFTPSASNVHQATVAFGRHHVVYVALAGWDVQDVRGASVLLARSTDLGDSWSTVLVRDARGKPDPDAEGNRPVSSVAVDRSGPTDVVYVGWTRTYPNARPARLPEAVVSVSADGGRTFGEPVNVVAGVFTNDAARLAALQDRGTLPPPGVQPLPTEAITAERFGGLNARLVVGPPGTVNVLWRPVVNVVGTLPSAYLSRSTDRGRTFTPQQIVAPSLAFGNPVLAWSASGGAEGTLHLAYEDKLPAVQGDRDIVYQRSTDGGRAWTAPVTLNDEDPKLLVAQFMPNLTVAPNGRVDVAWWDFRNDTGAFLNDVYLASSSDDGVSWSPNIRVTDRSVNRRIGPWSNGYDVRQPAGLAATARYTAVGWDDTRDGDADGQAQDIYSGFVQFSALPARTPAGLAYAAAGVVGLVLAGLVIVAIGMTARRRGRLAEGAQASPSTSEPAEVR